jgi:hypothetical protein
MEVSCELHVPAVLLRSKYPGYSNRSQGGLQSWSGRSGEEKHIPSPAGNQAAVVQPVA